MAVLPSFEESQNIGQFIKSLYNLAIGMVGLAVFIQFFRAGLSYLFAAGNAGETTHAKEMMQNAVLGAILLLSSYLILNVINPDLIKTDIFDLNAIKEKMGPVPYVEIGADTVVTTSSGETSDPVLKAQVVQAAFNNAGITMSDNVLVSNMHASTVNGLINVKNACPSCAVNLLYGSDKYPNGNEVVFGYSLELQGALSKNPAWTYNHDTVSSIYEFTDKTNGVVITCNSANTFFGYGTCDLVSTGISQKKN